MFRGDPRQPWIDLLNEKLIYRHLNMIAFASYMKKVGNSLAQFAATEFCSSHIESFDEYMQKLDLSSNQILFPKKFSFDKDKYLATLHTEITKLYSGDWIRLLMSMRQEGPLLLISRRIRSAGYTIQEANGRRVQSTLLPADFWRIPII